jgi:hypothetical protein
VTEVNRALIDRPNGWDAKPSLGGHMFGIALVMTLWTVFGLAFLVFLRGEPEELSGSGILAGRVIVLALLAFAWVFFGMHARSLVMVRNLTRDMAYKPFEGMRPDEVIAQLEEHLSGKGLPYRRLSLSGEMPREFVPGSMRYLKEIFEMEAVGTRFVLQPFSHGDDEKGIAAFTPVFLGPVGDDNWSLVDGLMNEL